MAVNDESTLQDERRGLSRGPLAGQVAVRFETGPLIGPGQNVSDEGVFFVAETNLRVKVCLDDGDGEWVDGQIVRVQSLGDGRIGMAVKFI